MNLERIVLREEENRYESLALCLRAVAEAAGGELDYDAACAAMGLSFAAVSVRAEPAPGWWLTCGRDLFLESAAELFGLRLRSLHPPDVGVEMTRAAEFAQHFEASYVPLIRTAIGNGQPVLAWQGWPGVSGRFWGVITQAADSGLAGVTLWAGGGVVPLAAPAMQCYVVESCVPRLPPRDRLLADALTHADAWLNRAPMSPVAAGAAGPASAVTGPAAFDAWEEWLTGGEFTGPGEEAAWQEHRQHAEFLVTSRRSGVAFLQSIREILPADDQDSLEQWLACCRAEIDELAPSCDEDYARTQFSTAAGREVLLQSVHQAEAAHRRLAMLIEEYVEH
jgi:hypothetical protein